MNSPTSTDTDGGEVSRDAFFGGRFHLLQPKSGGLRAGHDALLLAATLDPDWTGRALDLGSGAGAVALAAASRAAGLHGLLVERHPTMAELARRTLALPENAALASRLDIAELDALAPRPEREAAGLRDDAFDLVLTNPPFHPEAGRRSPEPMRDEAKAVPERAFVKRWLAVSAALLRHGGRLVMIGRPEQIGEILAATENRFGSVTVRPIHSVPDEPAIRILVAAKRGSRAPLRFLPGLILDAPTRAAVASGNLSITMD